MLTGWKDLTQNELAHLRESGIHTNYYAVQTFRLQAIRRADSNVKGYYCSEPCWPCRIIAKKLGYNSMTLDVLRDWAGWHFLDTPVDILRHYSH